MRDDKNHPQPTPEKRERARQFRRSPTAAEAALWEALRDRRCQGLKFRRQVPVGIYITDFLAVQEKLIIELDGSAHDGRTEYDDARTHALELHGYRVLRFPNERVLTDLPGCLDDISAVILGGEPEQNAPSPPNPLLPAAHTSLGRGGEHGRESGDLLRLARHRICPHPPAPCPITN